MSATATSLGWGGGIGAIPSISSAKVGKTGMPGRNFSGQVSIHMDHKGIPDHIRVCLVVKFIVNHFQSNKIMVWIVKEATKHLIR